MKLRSLGLLAAFALAACSGGGGDSPVVPGGGGGVVSPTPTPAPQPTGATASITIKIPLAASRSSSAKRPAYVSPSTSSLRVLVNTVNGGAPPSWVPTSTTTALVVGTNCTTSGGTETCTVPVAAPPGSVNYTFTAGDGTNALSTATVTETITQGTNNNLSVTLQGIVASVTVQTHQLSAEGPESNQQVTVSALDADSNMIVAPGNYNNPITLTDQDPTGATSLSVNGSPGAASVVTNSPIDNVTLAYNGQALNPSQIDAGAIGMPSAFAGTLSTAVDDITLSGITFDDAAHGGLITDPNWGQQTLFFSQASGTQDVAASEFGWTDTPYNKGFDMVLSAGCSGIASASAGPTDTFTITALGNPGICSARFEEHGTGYPITTHPAPVPGQATVDGTFWISVTTSSFGVNHTKI